MLTDDKSLARDKHCSVLYDPKGKEFYVTSENANSVYLNDELMAEAHKLNEGDVIKVGETKLKFIPFCREDMTWETE